MNADQRNRRREREKIIADREANGPFRAIDDLLRVKGIGPKTLEKMRPYLREPGSEVE